MALLDLLTDEIYLKKGTQSDLEFKGTKSQWVVTENHSYAHRSS
jgi:hypothetical protein